MLLLPSRTAFMLILLTRDCFNSVYCAWMRGNASYLSFVTLEPVHNNISCRTSQHELQNCF